MSGNTRISSYHTTSSTDHDYLARLSTLSTDLTESAPREIDSPPPPPVPPKPPLSTYSSRSSTTGSVTDAQHVLATRGRFASASSHALLSHQPTFPRLSTLPPDSMGGDDLSIAPSPSHTPLPRPSSLSSEENDLSQPGSPVERERDDEDHISTGDDPHSHRSSKLSSTSSRAHLAVALASSPWAEPPPRHSPTSPSMLHPPSPIRLPTPSSAADSLTRSPSTSGRSPSLSFSLNDPARSPRPGHSRSQSGASSVSSARSRREGDTLPPRVGVSTASPSPLSVHTPVLEAQWINPPSARDRPISGYSGMADVVSSNHGSDESVIHSLSAAIRRVSRRSLRSARSGKSIKTQSSRRRSTRSTKSKRTSGSTSTHRWGGKRWELGKDDSPSVGGDDDWVVVDVRQKEDQLDLLALAGRAAVLERMLRAGKRVSNSTIRARSRSSASSLRRRFTSSRSSRDPHSSKPSASSRSSVISFRREVNGSSAPRTSRSFRERLSRRLTRNGSHEDAFTELGEGSLEEEILDVPEDTGGIIVFPERISLPPPSPEKPNLEANSCMTITCISPASPSPFFDYSQNEKSFMREIEDRPVDVESAWTEQSPHSGHRSPGWRKRQSIMSYLSTGNWDQQARKRWWLSVAVGASVVLIIIVGSLAGSLTRRKGG